MSATDGSSPSHNRIFAQTGIYSDWKIRCSMITVTFALYYLLVTLKITQIKFSSAWVSMVDFIWRRINLDFRATLFRDLFTLLGDIGQIALLLMVLKNTTYSSTYVCEIFIECSFLLLVVHGFEMLHLQRSVVLQRCDKEEMYFLLTCFK